MEKKDLTKLEWILIILLISIVQSGIWYTAFINAKNASALNYISFAGTLISIILAILAIGYTYGESLGQKNKSDSVSSQIAVLSEVIRSIKLESQSLSQISTISDELTKFSDKFEFQLANTQQSVDNLSSSLAFISKDSIDNNSRNPILQEDTIITNKENIAKAITSTQDPLINISLLFIYIAKDKTYNSFTEMVSKNVVKYIDRASIEKKESVEKILIGAFLNNISILKTLGLINIDSNDTKITISDYLSTAFEYSFKSNINSSSSLYAEIINEVSKDISI